MDFPRWPIPILLMHPKTFNAPQIPVLGFDFLSNPNRIDEMLFFENPVFGFQKLWNPGLTTKPLFATAHSPVSAFSAPVSEQSAPGSAWERWEDRGHGGHGGPPRPIVPEPGAYGAAMLALVLAVVVARRLASLRSIRPR